MIASLSRARAMMAWFSLALFFCYQYIVRVSPGIVINEIRESFMLSAEQFATFGTFNLLAYSLLQIPCGLIVDRYGVKRIVLPSVLLCITGALCFAFTSQLWVAQLARVMTGAGSACAFMCAVKSVVDYFPAGRRGILLGATLAMGALGALISGSPMNALIDLFSWREFIAIGGAAGILLVVLFLIFVPASPHRPTTPFSYRHMGREILTTLKKPYIIIYSILAVGLYTPLAVLADLWGTGFIIEKYGLSRGDAAGLVMSLYVGMVVGSLILPSLAERLQRLNTIILLSGLAMVVLFSFMIYGPLLSHLHLRILMIAIGFFCGSEMICFTAVASYAGSHNSGLVLSIVNTFNMLGAALLQQLVGCILDLYWNGEWSSSGIRHYNTDIYVIALSVLTLVVTLSLAALFWVRRLSPAKPVRS